MSIRARRRHIQRSINPNMPNALAKVIEMVEVFAGIRGNEGDRHPTIDEVREMMGLSVGVGTETVIVTGGSSSPSGGRGSQIIPITPSGISATILANLNAIRWDKPSYQGHGFTEVWRSTSNDLTAATLIGVSAGTVFQDFTISPSTQYYYFLRHVINPALGTQSSPFSTSLPVTSHAQEPLPSQVLSDANDYTDQEISTLDNSLKLYADGKASTAESNANNYTDGKASAAESNANNYTDQKIQALVNILEDELQIVIPWPPTP